MSLLRRTALAVLLLVLPLPSLAQPAAAAAAVDAVSYVPPVEGGVLDPFRAPPQRWASGNRGIEYDTEAGGAVRAAADGEVVFAGRVAGRLHVSVEHADGVRTTYNLLASVQVRAGQRVRQGDALGTSGEAFHFGARLGDEYLDPALLFSGGRLRVRLVPSQRRTLADRVAEFERIQREWSQGGFFHDPLGTTWDGVRTVARETADDLWATVELARHYGITVRTLVVRVPRVVRVFVEQVGRNRRCTPSDQALAPLEGRRILVRVAGLGSDSGGGHGVHGLDGVALGYAPGDVVDASYGGGLVPDATDAVGAVPTSGYGPEDANAGVEQAAARLRQTLRDLAAANPGVPIDLVGHSQGGVVARLALQEASLADPVPPVDTLVTLGSPHQGAPLATGLSAVGITTVGGGVLDVLDETGAFPAEHDDASVEDLSEVSEVSRHADASDLPNVQRVVTVADAADLIVPVPATRLEGADQVILPPSNPWSAHDRLPARADAQREVALAVRGLGTTCRSPLQAAFGAALGEGVALGTDLLAMQAVLTLGSLEPAGRVSLGLVPDDAQEAVVEEVSQHLSDAMDERLAGTGR